MADQVKEEIASGTLRLHSDEKHVLIPLTTVPTLAPGCQRRCAFRERANALATTSFDHLEKKIHHLGVEVLP